MTTKPEGLQFLASPGSLGRQIAAFDWSSTPLGPLADWPQSLRTTVNLMLNSSHPIWIGWGPHATFLYNDAYIDVLGAAKHPWALGRPAQEVWAEIWHFCGPLADKVFQRAEPSYVDAVQLFMSRGDWVEEVWYSFSYSPIFNEAGAVGGLFCPSTDTTDTRLNARRLAALSTLSASALREPDVASACATAMHTIAGNPADIPFALLFKRVGDTMRLQQTAHVAEQACELALWPVDAVLESGEPVTFATAGMPGLPRGLAGQEVRVALALPITDGVLVLGTSPVRQLDAEYRTFCELVAGQLSAAVQNASAAAEQRQRAEALAELDRAKTAFFSNVSHEFRTPLTLMLGPIEEALNDSASRLPAAHHERLRLAQRNALRLQKLVNTLLDFSRVQAGRMQASYAQVDLAALTRDLASGFRSVVESAGLTLAVDCEEIDAHAWVDIALFEKIVLNLLSNAFKFTFDGGITVSLRQQGQAAVLAVTDTGVGISDDQQQHIFERFRRVEGARSRTHEGSGIGLALVRDLVELLHGRIELASTLGTGSTFTITLPLGRSHLRDDQLCNDGTADTSEIREAFRLEAQRWLPEEDSEEPFLDLADDDSVLTLGARVLVVDDNADMRDYLARLLRQRWHVRTAANGREALEAMAGELPDLVVSDVMMPELDGFGLIAAMRAERALHDVPVLLLSARAGEEARIEGVNAGADDYLVKPFSARELLTRVDSQLMRARIRQAERAHMARMASTFQQAPAAIAIVRGPDLGFELANDRFVELSWRRELIGLPMRRAFPELEGQGMLEEVELALVSGQPVSGKARRVMLKRESGLQECFFDYVHQPVRNARGEVDRVAIVAFEVTELVRARRDAELANRTKDDFLAMVGHELRNPLSPILIALELMRLKGVGGLAREHAAIERQAHHLVRLVDDLLDVARIAQGKIALRLERVELAKLLAQALETVSGLLEERQQALELEVPAQGLAIDADPMRFVQVLVNLLTNAAKYSNPGGQILVHAAAAQGSVVIKVRDTGIGIDAGMLPHLFDKFMQAPQSIDRSRGGLGLGLAIARSLVQLHGGEIEAHSGGVGAGSEFTIRVPQASEQAGAPALDATPVRPAAVTPRRVLLVDDNQDVLQGLRALLEVGGHEVQAVGDPASALRASASFVPDLAILDIGLPGMDGYELATELRRRPGFGNTRLVALSGYGQPADQARARAAGFAVHLVKPITPAQLYSLLVD
ncbi:Signal transduction histidine kinase [Duganella sp. CF458]|uniref:ATP-binding protein n=1 Tax=Duganella sp. CF458 TaxID=1884368 RepID=UPI0008EA11D7|nr:ATP-binding protein [Duganella sp. CF458]SFG92725.1 Signal transduction histidine kinase [Duganella sp. CF458]